jgi:acylphosphatase
MSDDLGEPTTLRLRIEGFVQAVGYRNFMITEATRLGLDGWVRNRSDGTVEALVSGPQKTVEALVQLAMHGHPPSRVKSVDIHNAEQTQVEKGFHRRPSI